MLTLYMHMILLFYFLSRGFMLNSIMAFPSANSYWFLMISRSLLIGRLFLFMREAEQLESSKAMIITKNPTFAMYCSQKTVIRSLIFWNESGVLFKKHHAMSCWPDYHAFDRSQPRLGTYLFRAPPAEA